ncbi:hypothetical protein Ddye_002303 [Dipteronia dyeriana]|uniref:PI3K/PI4K catalytic domain-containing protein n=1 Tax=Dipteronia dyeriana TaxID=168575 RepID=A0AAE0CUC4_9ROSI|nr:hypothetical protein Ddye_002303 [Dipteronia dyeriana]
MLNQPRPIIVLRSTSSFRWVFAQNLCVMPRQGKSSVVDHDMVQIERPDHCPTTIRLIYRDPSSFLGQRHCSDGFLFETRALCRDEAIRRSSTMIWSRSNDLAIIPPPSIRSTEIHHRSQVMEQVFGLVNTFLWNHRDTWKRRLGIRTYKVVPFTPSAGVLEWVDGTLPLGEYLIGSMRNGGAHSRYGIGDWEKTSVQHFRKSKRTSGYSSR